MPTRRPPPSQSSEPESASDKENTHANIQRTSRPNTQRVMSGKSTQTTPNGTQGTQKRRRADGDGSNFYDPNQPAQERRAIAKHQRVLRQRMNDNISQLQKPDDDSMLEMLKENEEVFKSVKQTTDAVHDAQYLVKMSETAYKRMRNFHIGGAAQATVDPDDFVNKLLGFAKDAPGGDDEEQMNELDWAWIGRETMCTHKRVPTTDFLLGPLSITKKRRTITRTQRNRMAIREEDKARPQQLNLEDVKKQENKVPALVVSVKTALEDFIVDHGDDDGMVDYLHFITNPFDFGQTVENMFYLSFLVKDGHVGLKNDPETKRVKIGVIYADEDEDGEKEEPTEPKVRRQMISSLTMAHWKKAIHLFGITVPAIEHRESEDDTPNSWTATQG